MKKVLPIVAILILLGGIVFGLGTFGIVNIPGITKQKVANKAASNSLEKALAPGSQLTAPSSASDQNEGNAGNQTAKKADKPGQAGKNKPTNTIDPEAGAESLAGVWNEMDSTKLGDLIKDWKDADVAKVFLKMDADKVAEVLALLDSKRASKISAMVEKQASVVTNQNPT